MRTPLANLETFPSAQCPQLLEKEKKKLKASTIFLLPSPPTKMRETVGMAFLLMRPFEWERQGSEATQTEPPLSDQSQLTAAHRRTLQNTHKGADRGHSYKGASSRSCSHRRAFTSCPLAHLP